VEDEMRGRLDVRATWRRSACITLALLGLGTGRAGAQSDVPLSVRHDIDPARPRVLRAIADVALCRAFDCERTASGALAIAPSARLRVAAEATTGRSVVRPASPMSTDARVDVFYGSAARQVWIGRSAGQLRGDDSLGAGPDRWMKYGAALRWRSVSVAVDLGTGSQATAGPRRPSAQMKINRWVDSLTGALHEDTVSQIASTSSTYDRTRWRSAALRLGWQSDQWTLGAVFGRAGSQTSRPVLWSTLEVERRMGRSLALVTSLGTYPASIAADAPRSRWMFGAGLIVATGRTLRESAPPTTADAAAERFVAIRVAPERYRVVARIADASRVELAADFTKWKPVAMHQDSDGEWSAEMPASPGLHRVSLRSDGGPWTAPPGLVAQDDGFGGTAGVFVIP
jgi:hypothetical protein